MTDNFIKRGFQDLMTWVYSGKQNDEYEAAVIQRQRSLNELMQYYEGRQRRPLRTTPDGKDYNILANMTGVIVNRSVSMLVGAGTDFNTPDDNAKAKLEEIYEANKGDIMLHDLVQFGSVYGTAFIKVIPDGRVYNGNIYPRLIALNPFHMTIHAAPDDLEDVQAYVNRWNVGDTAWREITEKKDGVWYVRIEKADRNTKGDWVMQNEVRWEYDWSPIHHTKNLPRAGSVYGMSDIEGIIELQDKYNNARSDINVILGNNAFPLRYTSGGKLPRTRLSNGLEVVDISPSRIIESTDENFRLNVAEMQSDLASSRNHSNDIRRDIFDITETVDGETLRMNASQITNFGLRVMYKDELAKNATKQMIYGVLLREVNQHLLELSGMAGVEPGQVIWGDPLPVNALEEINALKGDLEMGIVSKKTVAQIRNYDYDQEQANIAEEKATESALGGNLLRDFLAGNNN